MIVKFVFMESKHSICLTAYHDMHVNEPTLTEVIRQTWRRHIHEFIILQTHYNSNLNLNHIPDDSNFFFYLCFFKCFSFSLVCSFYGQFLYDSSNRDLSEEKNGDAIIKEEKFGRQDKMRFVLSSVYTCIGGLCATI